MGKCACGGDVVLRCEKCGADWVDDLCIQNNALRARVAELETALATLLDAAERQAAGFPLAAEAWFAVRDYARARLPEKKEADHV